MTPNEPPEDPDRGGNETSLIATMRTRFLSKRNVLKVLLLLFLAVLILGYASSL